MSKSKSPPAFVPAPGDNSISVSADRYNEIAIDMSRANTTTLQLGPAIIKSETTLECSLHGKDVGFEITAEANETAPTMKLVLCRFCTLEKLAKGL